MDNSYSHLAKHMSQGDVLQDMTAGKPAFPVKPLDKAVVAHMGVLPAPFPRNLMISRSTKTMD